MGVHVSLIGLAQYKILLNLTKEFIDSIQEPIVRREVSDSTLDELVVVVTEVSICSYRHAFMSIMYPMRYFMYCGGRIIMLYQQLYYI